MQDKRNTHWKPKNVHSTGEFATGIKSLPFIAFFVSGFATVVGQ